MSVADDARTRAEQMRAMPQEEREDAIAAANNVIGYERFIHISKQVELRKAYRKPKV